MPHKHKRKRDDDTSNFDLDPSSRAKPLAAYNKASIFSKDDDHATKKRRTAGNGKSKKSQDDTPKAFARLMTWHMTGKKPNGLDDGTSAKPPKKQRKQPRSDNDQSDTQLHPASTKQTSAKPKPAPAPATVSKPTTTTASASATTPKILPGETLSSFSVRVDQSLPLTSIPRSSAPNNPSSLPSDLQAKLKKSERTTKHNKRLQRMQADWRATEAKLRDKEADEQDELEDQREEETLLWSSVRSATHAKKGKKKRGAGAGANNDNDDDPWKELEKRRREETKQRSLQDVVKAPPVLKKIKSKFKTRAEDFDALDGKKRVGGGDGRDEELGVDVGSVPNAVGSLRRREELNATRKAVIEGYRKLHGRKRGVGERLAMSKAVVT